MDHDARSGSWRVAPVVALATAALAGCALQAPPAGEELQRQAWPQVAPPMAWTAAATPTGQVEDDWVASFGDPRLVALVAEAIAHNADLRVAAAAVEQAAAYVRIAGGSLYPAVALVGRSSAGDGSASDPLNLAALSASWELDLWGRLRYGRRAAEDQYAAAEADYAFAQQSIAALVLRGWVMACEATLQGQLAAGSVASAEQLLELAAERRRVGIGSEREVEQARASLQGFRDAQRQLELGRQQALRSLESLLGRYPAAELEAASTLPVVTAAAPAGIPAGLLERRPDVVAAERRVAAAFSRAQQAQAARLPQVSLSASGAYLDSDLLVLQDVDNPIWGLGLGLVMPLYAGGALAAQVELKTAEQKAAVAQFASTGLRAFGEVEGALAAEQEALERLALLDAQLQANERGLELENIRYRVGSTDQRSIAQQQLTVYGTRSSLLRVQADRVNQRINLYLALGGGFG